MQVLIIDDNETMREAMVQIISRQKFTVLQAADAESGLQELQKGFCDLVITDYRLPGMNGLEALKQIKALSPKTEVLVITAYGTIDLAVEAMHYGATDFITKPFSHEELKIRVKKIAEKIAGDQELERLSEENSYLRREIEQEYNFGDLIGETVCMKELYHTIAKVARTDSSVIIYGESGTGKEMVARAIHKNSERRAAPFIRVHCGALAEGVLESELFGHEKGAFTGALKRKHGRFELAHNGTIFLDEIGDISSSTQIKLLRVLQEREFERVGGEETLTVNVRVIAATHRDLQEFVRDGRFREDLYYRLHIIPIFLPALRQRRDDIPLLTDHFMQRIAAQLGRPNLVLDAQAAALLQNYSWPGNVRELENVLERAAVLADADVVSISDLPILNQRASSVMDRNLPLDDLLAQVEKQAIERALQQANHVKMEAARILGIKTSTLYYKIEKYGLE